MRIIPVLDVLHGQVVRGIAGRRWEYRPIVSGLTPSSLPLDVAEAFRSHFHLTELYLADLDAIAGAAPDFALFAALQARGFCLWVDAGIRSEQRALDLLQQGKVAHVVVGLETLAGPDQLEAILRSFPADSRPAFSLDLKGGQPLADLSAWRAANAWAVAQQVLEMGVEEMIVLDLERVGTGQGTGTEDLCRQLVQAYPQVEIITGGGIRSQEDLDRLATCGVKGVLVASALHDGRIKPSNRLRFAEDAPAG